MVEGGGEGEVQRDNYTFKLQNFAICTMYSNCKGKFHCKNFAKSYYCNIVDMGEALKVEKLYDAVLSIERSQK